MPTDPPGNYPLQTVTLEESPARSGLGGVVTAPRQREGLPSLVGVVAMGTITLGAVGGGRIVYSTIRYHYNHINKLTRNHPFSSMGYAPPSGNK
jgi:hypothetical protein